MSRKNWRYNNWRFWGLNKGELIKKADKGISIIICSTNKGKKLLKRLNLIYFLRDMT